MSEGSFNVVVVVAANICRIVENYKWATCYRSYGAHKHTTHTSVVHVHRTHCNMFHLIYMRTIRFERRRSYFTRFVYVPVISCVHNDVWAITMKFINGVQKIMRNQTKRNENLIAWCLVWLSNSIQSIQWKNMTYTNTHIHTPHFTCNSDWAEVIIRKTTPNPKVNQICAIKSTTIKCVNRRDKWKILVEKPVIRQTRCTNSFWFNTNNKTTPR